MNMPNADVAIASSAPAGVMVPKAQSAAPARRNPPSRGRARKKPPPAIRIASGIPLAPPCRVTPAPLRRRPQNFESLDATALARRASRRTARESTDFNPNGSPPVRVQIVNGAELDEQNEHTGVE